MCTANAMELKNADQKPTRDLSYLAGWLCGTPFLGLIGAIDIFCRGARRKAYQALLCGLPVTAAFFLFPPLTLRYLRTLDWPMPAPLKRGPWC